MGLWDNASLLKNLIKPYLPRITNEFLPKLEEELAAALYKEDESLQDGETESVFMLSREGDETYLRLVQLDDQARVVRSSEKRRVTDYLQSVINQAFN